MSITSVSQQPRGAASAHGRRAPSASRAQRTSRWLAAIVAVGACLAVASPASAAELVTNGGFETGTFSGWTTTQPAVPLAPWSVADASDPPTIFFFAAPSPPQGTYDALNGFDGTAGHYTLSQTISIPAAVTASLTWQDRLQYDHSGQARLLQVKILNPATDAVLATPYTYTTQPDDTLVDTGWQSHSADLSAFSGQTVKLVFDETIPEDFTGPAQAELDAISVQTSPGCTITGTAGNDTLTGTNSADVICGLGGNDTINAGNGADTVYAGTGNDTVDGGNSDDTLYGGSGDDIMGGGNGADILYGEAGNDTNYGETLLGSLLYLFDNGNDHIYGGPGDDDLDGQNGNDTLIDTDGTDTMSGSLGSDTINVQDGAGGDAANGGLGSDSCTVDTGDSTTSC